MENYLKQISAYYKDNKRTINIFLVSVVVGFVSGVIWTCLLYTSDAADE